MKWILIAFLGLSSILSADFSRNNSTGIVTDNTRDLQWQDNIVSTPMAWGTAMEYCQGLYLGGERKWRLPDINELQMIIDSSRSAPASIRIFQYTASEYYWSSTISSDADYRAIYLDFFAGAQGEHNKDYNGYVRCVRDK